VQGASDAEQSEMCKLQNIVKVRWQVWQTSLMLYSWWFCIWS